MKRNSKYIMTRLIDPTQLAQPAQVGVDLTISDVFSFSTDAATSISRLLSDSKVRLGHLELIEPDLFGDETGWMLPPGAYPVEFDQGLQKLRADENAYIIQRSSLNRVGVRIESSIFDPGFHTNRLGATMFVFHPIFIAQHARVAQLTIETNEETNNLYNGAWQGKATQ